MIAHLAASQNHHHTQPVILHNKPQAWSAGGVLVIVVELRIFVQNTTESKTVLLSQTPTRKPMMSICAITNSVDFTS